MYSYDPDKHTWAINITWTPTSADDGIYVTERIEGDRTYTRIGPVPEHLVEALIAERRAMFNTMHRERLKHLLPGRDGETAL